MAAVVVPIGVSEDAKAEEYKRLCAAFPLGPIVVAPPAPAPASEASPSDPALPVIVPTLVSLFVHENPRYSAPGFDSSCTLLAGVPTIEETMCGMRFLVSPQSFFQVRRVHGQPSFVRPPCPWAPLPLSGFYLARSCMVSHFPRSAFAPLSLPCSPCPW